MALIEHTLFGTIDKVKTAIDRLKMFEPEDGYHLAYSGGKDSDVILALAKMAGVKFQAVYNLTTVDPPELVHYVKTHPEVIISRPKKTMWQLIVENGGPPLRQMRYCCRILKERSGSGKINVTGVRRQESFKRSGRQMVEQCRTDTTKSFVHPIIDWTEADVWEFLKTYKIPYCSLYDEGFKRLGCILCPMAYYKTRAREAERWPKIAEQYKRACQKAYDLKISKGKTYRTFTNGEEMFNWWIGGKPNIRKLTTHRNDSFLNEVIP
jgi:phosphoadenosine phosphosulfate reductase